MKVILIRHTSVMLDGNYICYGFTDVAPRPSFDVEARKTVQQIKKFHPDKVFTSPLSRAVMLAEYCGYPDAVRDERLKEMNFGQWEQRAWTDINPSMDFTHFFDYYIEHPVPGGESLKQVQERVLNFLEEQKSKGYDSIMVFCHGGIINSAIHLIEKMPISEVFRALKPYGSVSVLDF